MRDRYTNRKLAWQSAVWDSTRPVSLHSTFNYASDALNTRQKTYLRASSSTIPEFSEPECFKNVPLTLLCLGCMYLRSRVRMKPIQEDQYFPVVNLAPLSMSHEQKGSSDERLDHEKHGLLRAML